MQNTEQDRLIPLAKNGDEYAISRLYENHCQGIFRFLYYRTGNRQVAEDLTSEVFIQMIRSMPKFKEGSGSFTSWLYTIARNQCIDHYRKTKMKIDQTMGEDLVSSILDTEETSGVKQQISDLMSKILELPLEQREIIELRFVSQLSIQETASALGRSTDSIKGMQYRALEALREKMKFWKEENHV
jgi:RNA polymerase sigma-70 factor (ECF subfamily)